MTYAWLTGREILGRTAISAVHLTMLPQLEPAGSAVIFPVLGSMMLGLQLQRGSLKRFQPMMVGSSCVHSEGS